MKSTEMFAWKFFVENENIYPARFSCLERGLVIIGVWIPVLGHASEVIDGHAVNFNNGPNLFVLSPKHTISTLGLTASDNRCYSEK